MDPVGDRPHPPPLPADLPPPRDDGAAAHISGAPVPHLTLRSTHDADIDLAELAAGALVLYVFPKMGRPGEPDPAGWEETPGAYGCTHQSCSFRDSHQRFSELGYSLAGLSAQPTEEQTEAAQRLHLPFPLLADPQRRAGDALGLPTFSIGGDTFYKRLTLVARDGHVTKIFYPVFPPNENADEVLAWIHAEDKTP